MTTRVRPFAILLGSLLLTALAFPAAGRAAESLAPGEATGSFSIDGKAVSLHHAYAMTQPSDFDETKTDTAILLTEDPLPDKAMENLKDLESAAMGKGNSLLLKLDESGQAIREVVHHSALGDGSLQMSGMTHSEIHVASRSTDAISGSASTAKEEEFLKHPYKSDVRFHAVIRRAFREPPAPDAATGKRLPPGGGEPGKAWMALHQAILRKDLAAIKKMSLPGEMPDMSDEDLKKGLELMAAMAPEKIVIEEGYVRDDDAVLYMTGMQGGEKQYGTVRLSRVAGNWRPAGEKWSNTPPKQ
jgi:hypothetical protein